MSHVEALRQALVTRLKRRLLRPGIDLGVVLAALSASVSRGSGGRTRTSPEHRDSRPSPPRSVLRGALAKLQRGARREEASAEAERVGLPDSRKTLVHRYTIDAEEAEAEGLSVAQDLTREEGQSAARQQTVAVAVPDAPAPTGFIATAREWTAAEIGVGTLAALLVLSSGVGLMLVSAADALSRSGHSHGSVLFWLGLFAIFLPVTARLTSKAPTRNERIGLLVLLGLASYLVKVFRDPFRFLYTDEFVHQYNALSILTTHDLFHENPFLRATPAYPGLEAPTAALSATTGMSTFAAGLVVVGVARLIMMLALFLLYETVTGSGRVAGLAAALYAASPHFLFFISDFSYESLALPVAILALAAALRAHPPRDTERRAWLIVALILTAGVVVTHHMTSYALIVTLLAICLVPLPWSRRRPWRPWTVACVATALTAAWLTLVARETVGYLSPVIFGALRETIRTAAGESRARGLFQSSGGAAQGPAWEHFVAFASALLVAVAVAIGVRAIWRRYRDQPAPIVFAVAAVAYVGSLALRLVPAAWESASRASEFLFIGGALTLALFTVWALDRFSSPRARVGMVVAAAILIMGGLISTTSSSTRLAEPYRVSVRGGTVEPQAAAAAQWAGDVLGPGSRIAAGPADGRFMLVEGLQHVFASTNPPIVQILKTKRLYPWEIAVLRRQGIRYIVTDSQPSGMDGANGYYFFRNQSDKALALAGMKFQRAGAAPVYDSGNIVVYDLQAGLR